MGALTNRVIRAYRARNDSKGAAFGMVEVSCPVVETATAHRLWNCLFSLLFNDKERLLELYNALNGTNYTDKPLAACRC